MTTCYQATLHHPAATGHIDTHALALISRAAALLLRYVSLQAVFEGKTHWANALKYLAVSWVGNFTSCILFAALTDYAELCDGSYADSTGCAYLAMKVAQKKVSVEFGKNFVRGIMCNWMVCMAVFLSSQAQDMTGKMVGIWFPISAFVAMGMEHSVANMYMLPLGLISGGKMAAQGATFDVTIGDILVKNMLPVSLGNLFAGAICVAASYSYAFGKLGKTQCGINDQCFCFKPSAGGGFDCLPGKKDDDVYSKAEEATLSTASTEVTPVVGRRQNNISVTPRQAELNVAGDMK